jgi:hypothetical protein
LIRRSREWARRSRDLIRRSREWARRSREGPGGAGVGQEEQGLD